MKSTIRIKPGHITPFIRVTIGRSDDVADELIQLLKENVSQSTYCKVYFFYHGEEQGFDIFPVKPGSVKEVSEDTE